MINQRLITLTLFIVASLLSSNESTILNHSTPHLTQQLPNSIKEAIQRHDYVLLFIYNSPLCQCMDIINEYTQALNQLATSRLKVSSYKIDTSIMHLPEDIDYDIGSIPVIILYINRIPYYYTGQITQYSLHSYVKNTITSMPQAIKTLNEIKQIRNNLNGLMHVIYFGTNEEEIKVFNSISQLYADEKQLKFITADLDQVYQMYNATPGTILILKPMSSFETYIVKFEGHVRIDAIDRFIKDNLISPIHHFDSNVSKFLFETKKPKLILFRYRQEDSNTTTTINNNSSSDEILLEIAKEFKNKFHISTMSLTKGMETDLALYLNIVTEEDSINTINTLTTSIIILPIVCLYDVQSGKKQILQTELTVESLREFVLEWLDGKAREIILKSQDIPIEQPGPAYKVVGKSFNDIVINSDKDVLLLFYAPWSGHCKVLAKTYAKLANRLKHNNPNLLIAEIDGTENEIRGIHLRGYPSIVFFPNGKKDKPIEFTNAKTIELFEAFLLEYSTYKVIIPQDDLQLLLILIMLDYSN